MRVLFEILRHVKSEDSMGLLVDAFNTAEIIQNFETEVLAGTQNMSDDTLFESCVFVTQEVTSLYKLHRLISSADNNSRPVGLLTALSTHSPFIVVTHRNLRLA